MAKKPTTPYDAPDDPMDTPETPDEMIGEEAVTVSKTLLQDMINTAVAAAVSSQPPRSEYLDVGLAVRDGIAEALKSIAPRKQPFGRYDPKSPFHKSKAFPKLTRPCFQNGIQLFEQTLFDEEIELLNQVHRPGRYLGRKIDVIVRNEGSEESVEIRYKESTVDDRMELKSLFTSLRMLLTLIVAEQAELDKRDPYRRSA